MAQETNNTVTTPSESPPKAQGQGTQGKQVKKTAKKSASPKAPKQGQQKKEHPPREKPAHMSKVDKVAAGLPALGPDAQVLFTAANNMSTADMNALVAHLNIEIRRRGVRAIAQGASSIKIEPGQRVQIRSGQPKFVGMQGTVSKVQRIRCYVRLDGRNKDDYFFIADVNPLGPTASQGSLAEVVTRLSQTPAPMDIHTIDDEDVDADLAHSATG